MTAYQPTIFIIILNTYIIILFLFNFLKLILKYHLCHEHIFIFVHLNTEIRMEQHQQTTIIPPQTLHQALRQSAYLKHIDEMFGTYSSIKQGKQHRNASAQYTVLVCYVVSYQHIVFVSAEVTLQQELCFYVWFVT